MVDLMQIMQEVKRGVAEMIDEDRIFNLIKNFYEKGEKFLRESGL